MASYVSFRRKFQPKPDAKQIMHSHRGFEVLLFESGNAKAVTYENTYNVEKNDVFLFAAKEMHGIYPDDDKPYVRGVLYIDSDFFKEMNCEHYLRAFTERRYGTENKIEAQRAEEFGILAAIKKVEEYGNLFMTPYDAVARAAVVELLHLIDKSTETPDKDILKISSDNEIVTDVMDYINEHITEKITLDDIEHKFHFSKNHLCRIFKKSTGYTMLEYMNRKRVDMARAMHRDGYSLYDAALEVGFGSYSSFYRAFIKEYGRTPRNDMSLK